MSQFQTYQSFNLQNRVVALRQELINLKSPQFYDMTQVVQYESSPVSITLQQVTQPYTPSNTYSRAAVIRFFGQNIGKSAMGRLEAKVNGNRRQIRGWSTVANTSLPAHQMDFWIWMTGSSAETIQITVSANMNGNLQIISQEIYDYPWRPWA